MFILNCVFSHRQHICRYIWLENRIHSRINTYVTSKIANIIYSDIAIRRTLYNCLRYNINIMQSCNYVYIYICVLCVVSRLRESVFTGVTHTCYIYIYVFRLHIYIYIYIYVSMFRWSLRTTTKQYIYIYVVRSQFFFTAGSLFLGGPAYATAWVVHTRHALGSPHQACSRTADALQPPTIIVILYIAMHGDGLSSRCMMSPALRAAR